MKTQSALLLFQYWNRLRNGAMAPQRTAIEPSDIREVLSQTFILKEEASTGEMDFRLAGTAISSFFGRQLRSTPLRQLFQHQHRAIVSRLLRNCYQESSVVLLGLNAATRNERKSDLEVLLMPLQAEPEGNHILGCIIPHEHAFWHGLEPVTSLDLTSIRVLDPDREFLYLANRPEIVMPPSVMPSESNLELTGTKSVAQFLIIQGGKSSTTASSITKR